MHGDESWTSRNPIQPDSSPLVTRTRWTRLYFLEPILMKSSTFVSIASLSTRIEKNVQDAFGNGLEFGSAPLRHSVRLKPPLMFMTFGNVKKRILNRVLFGFGSSAVRLETPGATTPSAYIRPAYTPIGEGFGLGCPRLTRIDCQPPCVCSIKRARSYRTGCRPNSEPSNEAGNLVRRCPMLTSA